MTTQRAQVLRLLRENRNGVCTSDFLNAGIPRFSARIQELRDEGHRIASQRVRPGQWRYQLVRESPIEMPSIYSPYSEAA